MLRMIVALAMVAFGALPLLAADEASKSDRLKDNMQVVQRAVESYSTDKGGFYPSKIDDIVKSYFPGGDSSKKSPCVGHAPVNPFTEKPEWPITGASLSADREAIVKLRSTTHEQSGMQPGTIEYRPARDSTGSVISYAIRGMDGSREFVMTGSRGHTMVLSNQ